MCLQVSNRVCTSGEDLLLYVHAIIIASTQHFRHKLFVFGGCGVKATALNDNHTYIEKRYNANEYRGRSASAGEASLCGYDKWAEADSVKLQGNQIPKESCGAVARESGTW
jgi:hypothetical protein